MRIGRALSAALAGVVAATAPACGQERPPGGGVEVDSAEVAQRLGGGERWKTDFSKIAVPPGEIVSGGPPKDGIPAIDDPTFEGASSANAWLDDREPVMVVERGEEAKAYPLAILVWHEIVNDRVGGEPVTVTYCPLCNTALAFDRRVGGRVLDFGTTGRLRHSDLVMYDRQTETWWQQASGEAIVGELLGTSLELVPANTLSWSRARELYPDLRVLSRDTGHDRRYGINPYEGYDTRGAPMPRFFQGRRDDRLPAMERIVAVDIGAGWAASFSKLAEARVVNATVEGRPIVVTWIPGAASALDAARIAEGRDVGQTAAFDRRVDGRTLAFERAGDGKLRDRETGTTWDLAGRGVAGPLQGKRLEAIPHGNHFWFAWAALRPRTELWTPD